MARKARLKSESEFYHVILKGINSQILFEEDEDRKEFLNKLELYKEMMKFELHGYCLMDNHAHIIIKDREENLDKLMKNFCISYVQYFNKKYERTGPLFNDRYKSEPIENDEYYMTAQRYIHQNPYKAGIGNTDSYIWSSYKDFIECKNKVVLTEYLNDLLGGKERFIEYMNEGNSDRCLEIKEDKITDKLAKTYIMSIRGIDNLEEIKNMGKEEKKEIILKCLNANMSSRQLSRLTGISRGAIDRTKK